ncbi:sigma-54-dependent transcriptional regulator [Pontibacter akesuensis]|uniref:DNA-binding transcriptional response regulator, NtrC family, contains REC, AAA-type ATPase, and a Fis-type DNA-binding domains n=1 Tax=Pontibacter akesuensis TaxID=388950 RepID=A0A1I7FR60_9BACT|nr:sigma-54 dependent transcriptional regulator [Pontibacter akesuensis]GHA60960.1 sigma-54-dependent Fis family transcriptional regulator [Pontibacter akesuensis]SFU38638.1 DNA-binding transcriptional response regulator, NtrC family, contains REC, AAA-type ATPase, and a Fis-type DNA-binding domains [Pontibacter akesuensis]
MEEQKLGRILVIDDNEDVLFSAKMLLRKHAKEVVMEKNPKKIPFLLSNDQFDLILLDMNFSQDITSGQEGFYWLREVLAYDPSAVVVMITAYGDVEMAVKALKEGATDFVLKPWQNEKLLATLSAAAKLRNSYQEVNRLREVNRTLSTQLNTGKSIILGESKPMRQLFSVIDKVAKTDADILLLGENGTGKEVIARTIHERSSRADKVFVTVDMGAVTESLFESELFGHKKGAFTDAKEDRIGRIEAANGGTLFLDEIGNLSPAMQAKLLTVLQRREVIRVGTNTPLPVNVRLLCATNMPLKEMVQRNEFRQDLLYRINTVELNLPPLRQRLDDLPLFATHFLELYAHKYKQPVKRLGSTGLKRLEQYSWPGNVRELQHALERASIMSDNRELEAEDFFFLPAESATPAPADAPQSLDLDNLERETVQRALQKHDGNISKAAKELGLSRGALYRRLEKYAL